MGVIVQKLWLAISSIFICLNKFENGYGNKSHILIWGWRSPEDHHIIRCECGGKRHNDIRSNNDMAWR